MAIDNSSLMGFAMLGSMKKAERKLAATPMMLTLMPGAPATKSALATVAVGTQARDSIRRQSRVVRDTLDAATEIIADPATPVGDHLAKHPALRDLAVKARFEQFGKDVAAPVEATPAETVPDATTTPVTTTPVAAKPELAEAAEMVVAAIGKNKGDVFTQEEAAKYQAFLSLLPKAAVDKIVKP